MELLHLPLLTFWVLASADTRKEQNHFPWVLQSTRAWFVVKSVSIIYPFNLNSFFQGLFVLWWGWLAFNSGSTYGVSGMKWQYAARAPVMTLISSFGGGSFAVLYSLYHAGIVDIVHLINGIIGSLVSVTAGCFLYRAWEAFFVGVVGSLLTCIAMPLIDRIGIDDPVGASAAHGVAGIWGVLAVGLFADNPIPLATTNGRRGLLKGGGFYLLGIQCLTVLVLTLWGLCATYLLLWLINKVIPIRMDPNEELLGADLMEHRIRHGQIGISRALSALAMSHPEVHAAKEVPRVGVNPGHEKYLEEIAGAASKLEEERVREGQLADSARLRAQGGGESFFHQIFLPNRKNSVTPSRDSIRKEDSQDQPIEVGDLPIFPWVD